MGRRDPIRRARAEEAHLITELALRSKAHWGYPPAFVEACRLALTLSPADIERSVVCVVERDGAVAGYYQLAGEPPEGSLDALFVDEPFIGEGLGRRLLGHAVATACRMGFASLLVESDPNAERFYLGQGAVRVGEAPSEVDPDRMLPLLRIEVDPA